jgi:hypothetical protein
MHQQWSHWLALAKTYHQSFQNELNARMRGTKTQTHLGMDGFEYN